MNKVTNFNKNISHMLALRLGFYFLLGVLISACSPAPPDIKRVQLGEWIINDAVFSSHGTLAISVSQDIGLYTNNGDLTSLFQLPAPEGIWQLAWQNQSNLWVYDRYHLYLLQLQGEATVQHVMTMNQGIRFIAASDQGLLLSTESDQVQWHAFTALAELQPAQTVFEYLPRVTVIGTTAAQQFYVATQQGNIWVWEQGNFQSAEHYKLEQPVLSLVTLEQSLYALSSESLSPLAKQNKVQLWPLKQTQQPILLANTQGVASTLTIGNTLVLGGSNNSWQSFNTHTLQEQGGYQQRQKPHQSSRIIAMHDQGSVILMLNSRGTLQFWPKTRIFEYP